MKQFSLLVILCCLLAGSGHAATVSGTVTNLTTGCAVINQKLYIADSFGIYSDSTITNLSGFYSFTVPTAVTPGDRLRVTLTACGVFKLNQLFWTGANATSSFTVCPGTPVYSFQGTIYLGFGGPASNGPARIYLIRKQYDTVLNDTVLTVIDSITSNSNGTFSKSYTSIPFGTLIVRAALLPSHPSYTSFLPTYDTNMLVWSSARVLPSNRFQTCVNTNINMTAGTNPSGGSGFIGGRVVVGAHKGTAVGDPIPNVILLMTDLNNFPVGYRYTDSIGYFGFGSLPYGTYKIFGDAWGKTNPALTVTITAAKPMLANIVFEDDSASFKGSINTVGVNNLASLNGLKVYPNPITDRVSINGLDAIGGTKKVMLRSIMGTLIGSYTFTSGQDVSISTTALPTGVYVLQLQTEAGNASFRIVKL